LSAASSFVTFAQDCLDYSGPFVVLNEFLYIFSVSAKNVIVIVIGIALTTEVDLGCINTLRILSFPIHDHGMSFHLFVFPLISYASDLSFY
jgi:hypothetical protein